MNTIFTNTYKATIDLSNSLNDNKSYQTIKDIAMSYFGKNIDNDSDFWIELENTIIDKIKEHE